MSSIFQIGGAIAIYKGDEIFFGMSQYSLLKLIVEEGSINAAAKRKNMPYQQAWNIIDQLNRISPIPIVIRQKGGAGGGGCFVSEYGIELMKIFENKIRVFNSHIEEMNKDLSKCII